MSPAVPDRELADLRQRCQKLGSGPRCPVNDSRIHLVGCRHGHRGPAQRLKRLVSGRTLQGDGARRQLQSGQPQQTCCGWPVACESRNSARCRRRYNTSGELGRGVPHDMNSWGGFEEVPFANSIREMAEYSQRRCGTHCMLCSQAQKEDAIKFWSSQKSALIGKE